MNSLSILNIHLLVFRTYLYICMYNLINFKLVFLYRLLNEPTDRTDPLAQVDYLDVHKMLLLPARKIQKMNMLEVKNIHLGIDLIVHISRTTIRIINAKSTKQKLQQTTF